jgi:hypothetical protein
MVHASDAVLKGKFAVLRKFMPLIVWGAMTAIGVGLGLVGAWKYEGDRKVAAISNVATFFFGTGILVALGMYLNRNRHEHR